MQNLRQVQVHVQAPMYKPSPKRNRHSSEEMAKESGTDKTSSQMLLDRLKAFESRMGEKFSNLNSQAAVLSCEFKEQINSLKPTLNDVEKSLSLAWTVIEDLREESKALRDSKSSDKK